MVEVLSPSTGSKDMSIKLFKYRTAGVREYWMIDPVKQIVITYDFTGKDEKASIYSFEDAIPSAIYPDLLITPASML